MILTGPTAAGKNTIGYIISKGCSQCAIVDFDAIRKMFVNPHLTPWEGKEGKAQQYPGIQHV
jgi:dephospho-CoA kinase